jgi:hypothetical protein
MYRALCWIFYVIASKYLWSSRFPKQTLHATLATKKIHAQTVIQILKLMHEIFELTLCFNRTMNDLYMQLHTLAVCPYCKLRSDNLEG